MTHDAEAAGAAMHATVLDYLECCYKRRVAEGDSDAALGRATTDTVRIIARAVMTWLEATGGTRAPLETRQMLMRIIFNHGLTLFFQQHREEQ